MKGNLIVLFGASGSGKTTILELIKRYLGNAFIIGRKHTTRPRRPTDANDMRVESKVVDETICDIIYQCYGFSYGINTSEIADNLKKGISYGIIAQDYNVITKLKLIFPSAHIIYVFRNLSLDDFYRLSKERKVQHEESNLRLRHKKVICDAYASNKDLFDGVVNNTSSMNELEILTLSLLNKLSYTSTGASTYIDHD